MYPGHYFMTDAVSVSKFINKDACWAPVNGSGALGMTITMSFGSSRFACSINSVVFGKCYS